ncbi:hypothetical protein HUJ04_000404 [Dendroctonus ponderosae]|nr:hypothetical protein HUJ04_000404 [Dendroctonus ponderosae]
MTGTLRCDSKPIGPATTKPKRVFWRYVNIPESTFEFYYKIIVVGIPYALHQAGFGFGVLLLVLVAYITDYSLILMIKAGHISGRFSYQGIMEAAFGRAGYILLGILQFVYPFIVVLNVSCKQNFSIFRPDHPDSWRFFNSDIIPAVGIMAFAFMCHHNTFLIYSSIADTSQKKWETVTHASILTSLIVSCIFGIAGYATFKAYCQGDLLENYCWDDDLMNASRILFSIQILLTYPIECFVTRGVIENSIISKDPNVPMSERTHYAITLSIVFTTYFISMATDCLGVVLELNVSLHYYMLRYY